MSHGRRLIWWLAGDWYTSWYTSRYTSCLFCLRMAWGVIGDTARFPRPYNDGFGTVKNEA